ncbi:HD domain-containing phosphohydrolase [Clostridium intestinale]|uniref:HD domain-containing phosphohydrolase n=1 Tax=Clostridium intestinale TaxID=36845 RepID=UPI002DD6B27F|nr:HD domain-containing phosphohydrolase [Clostridium intestinale]WRY50294.1 diguanylate cyclase [Clostridium intestinale]
MTNISYESILKNVPVGFAYHKIILDDKGLPCDYIFIEVNLAFEEMTGLKSRDIIGKSLTEVIPNIKEDNLNYISSYGSVALNGGIVEYEEYSKALDKWYRIQVYSDKKYYFAVNFLDISKQKEVENALKASEEKYRLITESTSDVIWVFNYTKYCFTYVSPSIKNLLGYTQEEALDITLEEFLTKDFLGDLDERFNKRIEVFLEDSKQDVSYILEMKSIHKNGDLVWVETAGKYRLNNRNEIEIVGVSRNISERKKAEEKIIYLSYHDQLTGIYNRRYYEEKITEIDKAENMPMTLVVADVNGLKLTNDAFGHLVGDKLLIYTAEVLNSVTKENDIVARIGGDEFVLLLAKTDNRKAKKIIDDIKKKLSAKKIGNMELSTSFGYAVKSHLDQNIIDLFIEAENYMYKNKLIDSRSNRSKTVKFIIKTLYEKNNQEEGHCKRVSKLCGEVADLLDMNVNEVNEIITAGLLHDIGKIAVGEKAFSKSEKLTQAENNEYKRHSEIGYKILKSSDEFSNIAEYILYHHECVDGNGYPKGLIGESIPIQSRILSIVDYYDNLINPRNGEKVYSKEEAIEKLKMYRGKKFDINITNTFIEKILKENDQI